METLEYLKKSSYNLLNPLVRILIKLGFTPNLITSIGLIINIIAASVFIIGAEYGLRNDFSYIGWGCALILFAGLFDMLDGQVARTGNMATKYGALYDSVLDRYSELIMFLGICYFLIGHHYFLSSLFAFIALIGSMMVSYTRARAEGLGIECKTGLMQRPERIIIIGVSGVLCGIISHFIGGSCKLSISFLNIEIFETITVFTLPLTLVAFLSNITAIKRLLNCKQQLSN